MPIYTKTGDRGETGLFDGRRVPKDDALIEAIGAVDELNATLGNLSFKKEDLRKIEDVQKDLFAIGARLAGAEIKIDLEERVGEMEREIDEMWKKMPKLANFILPRGGLHVARAVCRRAERRVVAVREKRLEVSIKYLNRLSDYLFCLARWENFRNRVKEATWTITS